MVHAGSISDREEVERFVYSPLVCFQQLTWPSPQRHDWSHIPPRPNFGARIVLPFVSTKYKTDITASCLQRALTSQVLPVDYDDENTSLLDAQSALYKPPPIKRTFDFSTFFKLYHAHFNRAAPLLFQTLRREIFLADESTYQGQFTGSLIPIDGLGFSGSLFFYTFERTTIVKSIGRGFEYSFFYEKMLEGYAYYYSLRRGSAGTLLCQILDALYCFEHRIGSWLGVSPSHYLVMKNSLAGLDKARGCKKWDLKPQSFFEPTRDLVPDSVLAEAARSGLADELPSKSKIVLIREDRTALMTLLEQDTKFLEEMGTVDYSLLLGRYPVGVLVEDEIGGIGKERDFGKGVRSADGRWIYRICIVDFLWNVDQLRTKVMKTAGKLLPEQTITTEPERYRKEFLR